MYIPIHRTTARYITGTLAYGRHVRLLWSKICSLLPGRSSPPTFAAANAERKKWASSTRKTTKKRPN